MTPRAAICAMYLQGSDLPRWGPCSNLYRSYPSETVILVQPFYSLDGMWDFNSDTPMIRWWERRDLKLLKYHFHSSSTWKCTNWWQGTSTPSSREVAETTTRDGSCALSSWCYQGQFWRLVINIVTSIYNLYLYKCLCIYIYIYIIN